MTTWPLVLPVKGTISVQTGCVLIVWPIGCTSGYYVFGADRLIIRYGRFGAFSISQRFIILLYKFNHTHYYIHSIFQKLNCKLCFAKPYAYTLFEQTQSHTISYTNSIVYNFNITLYFVQLRSQTLFRTHSQILACTYFWLKSLLIHLQIITKHRKFKCILKSTILTNKLCVFV